MHTGGGRCQSGTVPQATQHVIRCKMQKHKQGHLTADMVQKIGTAELEAQSSIENNPPGRHPKRKNAAFQSMYIIRTFSAHLPDVVKVAMRSSLLRELLLGGVEHVVQVELLFQQCEAVVAV
jgi:hypothetical protein